MAQNLIVNSDYNIDVGANEVNITASEVNVIGNFVVTGTTTTVDSANMSVTDNNIVLNQGEAGAGVTLGSAGITVDRGSVDDATLIWDETTDKWNFKVGASTADLVANVSMDALELDGVTVTDIITEAETIAANDNDTSLPTSAAVKAYADAIATSSAAGGAQYDVQYNTGAGLGGNSNFTVNYTTNVVSILGELNVDNININGNDIISSNVDGNITLTPNGVGNIILAKETGVSVQLDFTDQGSDPSATATVNKIYSKTPSGGGTGLYFVNNTTTGEFISKSKSIAYSLVFGG
jgi:hypothetical protein